MAAHQVTLVFEDGRVAKFSADEDDTIYLAALKNRVRILTDCLEGDCATCKGLCTSGEYRLEEHSGEALTEAERDRREVLTCRMHVLSDCVIEYPYASRTALRTEPDSRAGRVAEVETVASAVARLAIDADSPVSFIPGQYVHLSVPGTGQKRSYSFANPVDGRPTFYVKLLERGAMSDYISNRAAPGDEIVMTGPFGRFYLRPARRPIVMVAGGTGLAPMLGMLDTLAAEGCGHPVRLLYGANLREEMFALDRLRRCREEGLDLEIELSVVDPSGGWDGETGHVTGLLRPEILNSGDCEAYLCGPPPMIEAAETALAGFGVDSARVHAEKFVAS